MNLRRFWTRRARAALAVVLALGVALFVLFPGRRFGFAFTLATGVGRQSLQDRIDAIEEKAISRVPLDEADLTFLTDFYRTLATGGKVTLVLRQTGRLMEHYLDGSGADFRLEPAIFTQNEKVQTVMRRLRRRATSPQAEAGVPLTSPAFHMPDSSKPDSVFGLYWGTVSVTPDAAKDGTIVLRWRAEVPWTWPSYASLEERHGTPHAESFPIPSVRSFLFGEEDALHVDNGLGEHLAQEGLARPFLAYAEWDEEVPVRR